MRMQHYAIFLRGFNYDIRYRRSEQNGNANCLSRLPLAVSENNCDVINVYYMETLDLLSINAFQIRELVKKDEKLHRIITPSVMERNY